MVESFSLRSTLVGLSLITCVGCGSPSESGNASVDAGSEDLREADAAIFFYPGDATAGYATRCFAGNSTKAKSLFEQKAFTSPESVTNLTVEKDGGGLVLHYDYFDAAFTTEIPRCPFTFADTKAEATCRIRLGSQIGTSAARAPAGYEPALDAQWRSLTPPAKVIDCTKHTIRNITNTWQQELPIAQVKTLAQMMRADGDVKLGCGSIGLLAAPGLEREQHWSGLVGMDLFIPMQCMEESDASMVQMSVDAERQAWIAGVGTWGPWSMRVVSLECDGLPRVTNPSWTDTSPLDMNAADTTSYCATRD